jgi:hypothetical protein
VVKSSDWDLTGSPGVSGWIAMRTPDLLDGHADRKRTFVMLSHPYGPATSHHCANLLDYLM